jgi:branched-chain amino acid aminotransferase
VKHRIDIDYFIKGENLVSIKDFPLEIASKSGMIYEVIRVNNAKPLFLKEHLERLRKSFEILNMPQHNLNSISGLVDKLIEANGVKEGNIKIAIAQNNDSAITPYLYFIPHRYPNAFQIENGIKTLLQYDERKLPQAKIADWLIRGRANSIIDTKGVYETLLINSNNEITEGSRSNVFFIRDNELITASDNDVLSGITREKVIEIANNLNITLNYRLLPVDDLRCIDAAFITGTSPGVLQIKEIEDIQLDINNAVYTKLFDGYNGLI